MLRSLKRMVAPVAPDLVERAFVERARAGDAGAFRALFDRYALPVRRFLNDLLRDATAAEEATQETFVRAHQRLDSLTDPARLASWLFGIARNVSYEHRRAAGALELADDDEAQAAILDAVLPTPSPEALLLNRELEQAMTEALGQISAPRRAALLLRIDHGLGYDEICQVMGWSLPTVKNEIHRARLKLRVLLARHVRGSP